MVKEAEPQNIEETELTTGKEKVPLNTVDDLTRFLDQRRLQVSQIKISVNRELDAFDQATRRPEYEIIALLFKAGLETANDDLRSFAVKLAEAYKEEKSLPEVLQNFEQLRELPLKNIFGDEKLEMPPPVDTGMLNLSVVGKTTEIKESIESINGGVVFETTETQEEKPEGLHPPTQEFETLIELPSEEKLKSPQELFLDEHPAIGTFLGLKDKGSIGWKKFGDNNYVILPSLKVLIVNSGEKVTDPTHNNFILERAGKWMDEENKLSAVVNIEKRKGLIESELVSFLMFVDKSVQRDLDQGKLSRYEVRSDNPSSEELLTLKKKNRLMRQKNTDQK